MIHYFVLEGLIGAGKSTLINTLRERLSMIYNKPVIYLEENIENWIKFKEGDKNIIELFYTDKKRYGFEFQLIILNGMLEQISEIKGCYDDIILISERSLRTSQNVFQQLLFDEGNLTAIQKNILENLYDKLCLYQHGIIYLDVDIETCLERINKRKRHGESAITFDYLEKLKKQYTLYLCQEKNMLSIYGNSYKVIPYIESFIKHSVESKELHLKLYH